MARLHKQATLTDLPALQNMHSMRSGCGLPIDLIKAQPNLLTALLHPDHGYLKRVKEVYHYKELNKANGVDLNEFLNIHNKNNGKEYRNVNSDRLTLILDVERTLISFVQWTSVLRIGQTIDYDEEPAIVSELDYMVSTENDQSYLIRITDQQHAVPRKGCLVNGDRITAIQLHQMVIQLKTDSPSPASRRSYSAATATATACDTEHDVSATECDSPTPIHTVIIDVNSNDDADKIKRLDIDKLLQMYFQHDEVLKIGGGGGLYVALRPELHEFLFLCCQLFDVHLFSASIEQRTLETMMTCIGDYLCTKLSASKKHFEPKMHKLWRQVHGAGFCDDDDDDAGQQGMQLKNICKFGVDLSRVIVVDHNELCCRGFEPNLIKINAYEPDTNDTELMQRVWPILFECYKYNDVRYGLLGKLKMTNTPPICSLHESLSFGMKYLVTLQYSYFKLLRILAANENSTELQTLKTFANEDLPDSICYHSSAYCSGSAASFSEESEFTPESSFSSTTSSGDVVDDEFDESSQYTDDDDFQFESDYRSDNKKNTKRRHEKRPWKKEPQWEDDDDDDGRDGDDDAFSCSSVIHDVKVRIRRMFCFSS